MEYMQMTMEQLAAEEQGIREEFRNMAESFARSGWRLTRINRGQGFRLRGYKTLEEYALKELGIKKDYVWQAMRVYERFGIDGEKPELKDKFKDFNFSKLVDMCYIPEEDMDMVRPELHREGIRELRRFNQENENSPDRLLNWRNPAENPVGNAVEEFFRKNKEKLNALYSGSRTCAGRDMEEIKRIVRAGKQTFRKEDIFMVLYEDQVFVKGTTDEHRDLTWEEFFRITDGIFSASAAGEETWKNYFEPENVQEDGGDIPGQDSIENHEEWMPEPVKPGPLHGKRFEKCLYLPEESCISDTCSGCKNKQQYDRRSRLERNAKPYYRTGGEAYDPDHARILEKFFDTDTGKGETVFYFCGTEINAVKRMSKTVFYDAEGDTLFTVENRLLETDRKIRREREDMPEKEEIAPAQLSAYGTEKREYPQGSIIEIKGCKGGHDCFLCSMACDIRQEDRRCRSAPCGNPFPCTTMNVLDMLKTEAGDRCQFVNHDLAFHWEGDNEPSPCCKACTEPCGYECSRSAKKRQDAAVKAAETEENTVGKQQEDSACCGNETEEYAWNKIFVKDILETEEKALKDYHTVGGVPQTAMIRQEALVKGLRQIFREVSDPEEEEEPAAVQPELPVMKNNDQRKEWLRNYKAWGLWYEDRNIGAEYYKYDFDNGARLIAEVYTVPGDEYVKEYESCYFHLVGGPEPKKKGYITLWTRHETYSRYPNSETELAEFLKEVQRK